MVQGTDGPMTILLHAIGRGETGARERLWSLVYDELHRLARAAMSNERGPRTLQTTALVHEAFFRLGGTDGEGFNHRGHFFSAAAEAMRRILVDDARRRGRKKRGGGRTQERLSASMKTARDQSCAGAATAECQDDSTLDLMALDEALSGLAEREPQLAKLVELRYFAGLTIDETAAALGMSPRKVDKDWRFAKAWLRRAMTGE